MCAAPGAASTEPPIIIKLGSLQVQCCYSIYIYINMPRRTRAGGGAEGGGSGGGGAGGGNALPPDATVPALLEASLSDEDLHAHFVQRAATLAQNCFGCKTAEQAMELLHLGEQANASQLGRLYDRLKQPEWPNRRDSRAANAETEGWVHAVRGCIREGVDEAMRQQGTLVEDEEPPSASRRKSKRNAGDGEAEQQADPSPSGGGPKPAPKRRKDGQGGKKRVSFAAVEGDARDGDDTDGAAPAEEDPALAAAENDAPAEADPAPVGRPDPSAAASPTRSQRSQKRQLLDQWAQPLQQQSTITVALEVRHRLNLLSEGMPNRVLYPLAARLAKEDMITWLLQHGERTALERQVSRFRAACLHAVCMHASSLSLASHLPHRVCGRELLSCWSPCARWPLRRSGRSRRSSSRRWASMRRVSSRANS